MKGSLLEYFKAVIFCEDELRWEERKIDLNGIEWPQRLMLLYRGLQWILMLNLSARDGLFCWYTAILPLWWMW